MRAVERLILENQKNRDKEKKKMNKSSSKV